MAAVDILYIDITRRWNSVTLDQRDTGTRWLPCLTGTGKGLYIFRPFMLWRGGGREMEQNLNPEP